MTDSDQAVGERADTSVSDTGPDHAHVAGTNIQGDTPDIERTVETDEATVTDDAELERTLGLSGGLAIGIGTMIGAGIFVFPGIAAGEAGPAAAGSFAIGGLIALLVALRGAEGTGRSGLCWPSDRRPPGDGSRDRSLLSKMRH